VALKHELDFKSKLEATVRKKPLAWFGGAAALGWWIAGPKTKKRVVTKYVGDSQGRAKAEEKSKAKGGLGVIGIAIALFRFALPFIKPTLSSLATRKLAEMAEKMAR
jgi:hypothetical protein